MSAKPISVKGLVFDPGLSNMAWAAVTWKLEPPNVQLKVERYGTVKFSSIAGRVKYTDMTDRFTTRTVVLRMVRQCLYHLFEQYTPEFVVCEGSFFGALRPLAFEALVQWRTILQDVAYEYGKTVYRFSPKAIKRLTTGDGNADKMTVQEAIIGNADITFRHKRELGDMSKDESDAVAVAYSFGIDALPELMSSGKVFPAEKQELTDSFVFTEVLV